MDTTHTPLQPQRSTRPRDSHRAQRTAGRRAHELEGFEIHPRLRQHLKNRLAALEKEEGLD